MRIQPIFSSAPLPASEDPDLAITAPLPSRPPAFPRLVETAAETLWAILLFLVIGFFLAKGPAISAVFDEASSAFRRGGEPAVRVADSQIQDLELRMAAGEQKLAALERGYAQLKQRHADLLRAYSGLLQTRTAQPGKSAPRAAPK